MIRRDRRNAAPIVDAGVDQFTAIITAQIRRCLNVHLRPEQQTRHRDGPQQFLTRRIGHRRHAGAGFGAKVLDNDFLYMAILRVHFAYGQQGLNPFGARLTDADQQPRGKRHAQFTRHA